VGDLTSSINYSISVAALTLMVMSVIITNVSTSLEKSTRRFFYTFFLTMLLYVISNLLSQFAENMGTPAFTQIAIFSESLFSSLLMPMLTLFILDCTGEKWRESMLFFVTCGIWLIYILILLMTQITTFIYYISPDNVYHRGPLYPVLLVPPVLIMGANLIGVILRRKMLSQKQFLSIITFIMLPMLAMIIQMIFFGLYLIVFATAVSGILLLLFILTDQMEDYAKQQKEIAQQRASIMVLQMRPHFIYNTMMSIYYLVQQDSVRAQKVILDFTSYLRKNFTAIAKEDTIPFTEELEHTRAYLAVEQVRFEDKLFVEYVTPETDFRLPPLTLQPIVENAVKHGIDPELGSLYISIYTEKTPSGVNISVEDSGPGFEASDNNEPHVALANIRERLKIMCDGELEIKSRKSGGTAVTIKIPYPKGSK
jgi:hypothetical protein